MLVIPIKVIHVGCSLTLFRFAGCCSQRYEISADAIANAMIENLLRLSDFNARNKGSNDKKRKNEKLSSTEFISRTDFKVFHFFLTTT